MIWNGVNFSMARPNLQRLVQFRCIFDINKEQKHILDRLIRFALKNQDKRQKWYEEQFQLATKKASPKTFFNKPWKKWNKNYSTDFANNICNNIKHSSCEGRYPLEVHNPHQDYKNNELPLDLISKCHVRNSGFRFYWPLFCS